MSDQVVQEGLGSAAPGWPAELNEEYEFLGELGRGGMAVVYRARERALGRDVAVKVVRPRFHSDEESVARLAREARTVAQLEHPNIVSLHAIKRLKTGLALVMQLVPGQTLKAALAEGPLAAGRAQAVLQDIARALDYAHRRDVVHRDVKPENIFLDDITGRALLSDFGVARSITENTELTATGTAIGTPTYMSPEQIDGGALDGRSDLYALGMVGWEMLSGQHPWEGESLYRVIYHQKHSSLQALDELRTDVPPRLQFLVEGLMQKRPEQRVPGAGRLLTLLARDDELPGFREWQRSLKRRRKRGGLGGGGGRVAGARTVGPIASTVRFRRGDAARGVFPPPSPLDQQRITPSDAIVMDAVDDATPWELLASERDNVPRSGSRRALLFGAAALALAAVAAITIFWPRGGSPESSITENSLPLGDRRGIEVPVIPSAATDSTGLVDSMVAGGVTAADPESDSTPAIVGAALSARDTASAAPPSVAATTAAPVVTTPAPVPAPARDTVAVAPIVEAPPRSPEPPPASVTFAVDRGSVAAGARHSCTLDENGGALCWGNNESGQLGDGGFQSRPTPAPIAGNFAFAFLSAGNSHTCGVTRDGEAYCWGANGSGQLGDGTTSPRSAPVRVRGSANFRIIRTGSAHSCGLTTDGRVQCWGSNARGQLGSGSTASRAAPATVSLGMAAGALAVGQQHSCAITVAGTALCWGRNDNGQLGDGSTTDRRSPVAVTGNRKFVSISAGGFHTCAVTTASDVYCWGRNRWGQLGNGNTLDSPAPVRVDAGTDFLTVTAGLGHTCARGRDGRGWCWGRNAYGQLGDGSVSDRTRPTAIRGLGSLSALSATGSHTCAVSGGASYCWGWNVDGQLGVGHRENASTPSEIAEAPRP